MEQRVDDGAPGRFVGALAHDLLNPLASLQGCAQTLLDADLPRDAARELARIILVQAERIDWRIRAAAADAGVLPRRRPVPVDLAPVVADASQRTGVPVEVPRSRVTLHADPDRLRLGIEALLFAMVDRGSIRSARLSPVEASLVIHARVTDLAPRDAGWKVDLARELLEEEGAHLTMRPAGTGIHVTVRFSPGAHAGTRRIA